LVADGRVPLGDTPMEGALGGGPLGEGVLCPTTLELGICPPG